MTALNNRQRDQINKSKYPTYENRVVTIYCNKPNCDYVSKNLGEFSTHLFADHDMCPYPYCNEPFSLDHIFLAHFDKIPAFKRRIDSWMDDHRS
jgi:hypothetical protein